LPSPSGNRYKPGEAQSGLRSRCFPGLGARQKGTSLSDVPAIRPEDIPIPDWMREHLRTFGPDGLICVDGSGTILGWNDNLVDILGEQTPGGWVLRPMAEILGWPDGGPQHELFEQAEEGGSARKTVKFRGPDDSMRSGELTVTRASRPGEARCFFIYLRDQSNQRSVTRDFMELQIQHRMLMNLAGGLVLVVQPGTGKVLHANEGSEEYFRRPVAQIRGRVMADLLEEVEAFNSQGADGGLEQTHSREIELSIPSPLGTAWVVQFHCNTIAWHGSPAILWIGRDVSDRRASSSAADLMASPAPATVGLHLPVGLVTPVAESMRHPAAQVELIARHCLENADRPWREQRERLEQIQELGDQVRTNSEDLLYLTRIIDGSLDIRRTETTVGRILNGVLPRLQRRARNDGSEIMTVQLDEDAPIFSDARLLMHSLRRFVDRALETEGTTVTMTAVVEGDCVRFTLIDSAPALDDERLANILDGERLLGAARGDMEHLGDLPTMLAVRLFRALGGQVEIASSKGMGTRVVLTLLS
jgi:signal transduction histidine kinase